MISIPRVSHLPFRTILVAIVAGLPLTAAAQSPPALGTAVVLVGSANEALSVPMRSGPLTLDLYFQVARAFAADGMLTMTPLLTQTPAADVVPTTIGRGNAAADDAVPPLTPLRVALKGPDLLHVRVTGQRLRPAAVYKGTLILTARNENARWEITVTTGGRGTLAVTPVGPVKFAAGPICVVWGTCDPLGSFPVTMYDKSEGGPYHAVRVRFEPPATTASVTNAANFGLDSLSFSADAPGAGVVDLARRNDTENSPTVQQVQVARRTAAVETASVSPGRQGIPREAGQVAAFDDGTLDVGYKDQRTVTAYVASLPPGEYTGTLRFLSDESEDVQDAVLPLTILVRHHWSLPVLVLVLGSLVGWFSSKYVVGRRTGRTLAGQVRLLQERVGAMTRSAASTSKSLLPEEASSYGLIRVRVMVSQLGRLTSSTRAVLVDEEGLRARLQDAETRMSALEALRSTRLELLRITGSRPTAEVELRRILRSAHDVVGLPTFDRARQTEFETLLQQGRAWLGTARDEKYLEALDERRKSREIPVTTAVGSEPKQHVRTALLAQLALCPPDTLKPGLSAQDLANYDDAMAKAALLWRERKADWADDLAQECNAGRSIDLLYEFVDARVWECLEKASAQPGQLSVQRDPSTVGIYKVVEVELDSRVENLPVWRIQFHPLRVAWHVTPPGGAVREVQTDGLTLPQYFKSNGEAKVTAQLSWAGKSLPVEGERTFNVVQKGDADRGQGRWDWTDWSVIAVAMGFAVASAMVVFYTNTFGQLEDYVGMFLWAAGAGTGGNVFKHLGTTSTPGGQAAEAAAK